jgi:hypothetical protein
VNSRAVLSLAVGICFAATGRADDEKSIKDLHDALVALSPHTVDPREAELLSVTAHTTSRQLAREYGVNTDPAVHNYLINIGVKKRGICADYTHDIGARLREMRFKTLVLHWGTAWEKESDENNALVVTARNQSFYDGIVLDGWRRAGRLFWCLVKDDAEYESSCSYRDYCVERRLAGYGVAPTAAASAEAAAKAESFPAQTLTATSPFICATCR